MILNRTNIHRRKNPRPIAAITARYTSSQLSSPRSPSNIRIYIYWEMALRHFAPHYSLLRLSHINRLTSPKKRFLSVSATMASSARKVNAVNGIEKQSLDSLSFLLKGVWLTGFGVFRFWFRLRMARSRWRR